MNKFVSLILPIYARTVHYGQTPNSFSRRNLDKFEAMLIERSNLVLKDEGMIRRQAPDNQGNGTVVPTRRYDLVLDLSTPALAEIVAAAMDQFELDQVPVVLGADAELWNRDTVEAFGSGLHEWNQDAE